MEQLAGAGADDRRAEDPVLSLRSNHLHEPPRGGFGDRAVELVVAVAVRRDRDAVLLRVLFAQAEMRDLGIHVSDPGHEAIVGFRPRDRPRQEDVADHDPRLIVGGVGEAVRAGHVAGGVDAARAGAKRRVHPDPLTDIERDPRRLEAEAGDVGASAGGDEKTLAGESAFAARRFHERLDQGVVATPEGTNPAARHDANPLGGEDLAEQRRRLPIIAGEQPIDVGEQRHLDPEAAHHLAQFAADRAAAEDEERLRRRALPVEEGLVGEGGNVREPVDGRSPRRRAGGDHEVGGGEARAVCEFDLARTHEPGPRQEDVHPEAAEALRRVVRGDRRPPLAHVLEHPFETETGFVGVEPVRGRFANRLNQLRRRDERLRGDAAVIQAVASHLRRFGERHAGAEPGRAGGGHEPGGSAPDDDDVVAAVRAGHGARLVWLWRGRPGGAAPRVLSLRWPRAQAPPRAWRGERSSGSMKRAGAPLSAPSWSPAWCSTRGRRGRSPARGSGTPNASSPDRRRRYGAGPSPRRFGGSRSGSRCGCSTPARWTDTPTAGR